MKFIVKLHAEIMIKSKPVRRRFSKMLETNIRNVLRRVDENAGVNLLWDHIEVTAKDQGEKHRQALIQALSSTPGIPQFIEVAEFVFTDLEQAFQDTKAVVGDTLDGKTFCMRVKRTGKHDFTSNEAERYIGGGLNQHTQALGVKLKNPDVTVRAEIRQDKLFVVKQLHFGLGGFPIATQEDVLSLISGGFDSGVSSYEFIRRGSRVHYLFFNLGGAAHEIGVKQVAHYLWSRFGSSHKVKFISVDFEPVVAEILENVENSQMGVVLKRMMMRAGALVSDKMGIQALVTGEALGQVSSQTLTNLSVIDRVTDRLILRPLITMDKQSIIDTARKIGTAEFAETIPEYCGVISKKPTVKAVLSKIESEEANFDLEVLDKVVENARIMDIRDIANEPETQVAEVEETSEIPQGTVVLDIRSDEEEEEKPLELDGVDIEHIPFFKLATKFGDLPQDKDYLLYCDRGVMSKLQALYLKEAGYNNVGVFRP